MVRFFESPFNPELAAINEQYFDLFDKEPYNEFEDGPYESLLAIQGGNALLNGQSPSSTYGLWSYFGTQGNDYGISNNSQFRVSAAGSGDIGDHALQMGFEYEQRRDAFFSLSPIGLWTLARLTTNSHIKEIDLSDSTITNIGTVGKVRERAQLSGRASRRLGSSECGGPFQKGENSQDVADLHGLNRICVLDKKI